MGGLCPVCGLPTELCVCKKILAEQQEIIVREVNKKFKKVTEVRGLDPKDAETFLKQLKKELACGGTIKDGVIELQGRHTKKVRSFLINKGFAPENIKS